MLYILSYTSEQVESAVELDLFKSRNKRTYLRSMYAVAGLAVKDQL